MKNLLYHYTCLVLSLAQAFLWLMFFWLLFVYGAMMIAPMIIIAVIQFAITGLVDANLRKMTKSFPLILLAFLLSPLRFIGEAVTIVRLHKRGLGSNFAARGDWHYRLGSQFLYALFSTDDMGSAAQNRLRTRRQRAASKAEAKQTRKADKKRAHIFKWVTRDEETGEFEYYKEKNFIHRLFLNLLTLVVAAGQAALSWLGIILIFVSHTTALPPVLSVILGILSFGAVFLLTMLDSYIRCFDTLTLWLAFLVSPVRVVFQAITLVAVVVTLFTRHKRFADMEYVSRYPLTCFVYALTSICYLSPAAKARKAADDKREKEEFRERLRAEEARREAQREAERRRREAERERRKNLPHDTDMRGFCRTQFFPNGHCTSLGGGRRGFRITSQRACIEWGCPTLKVSVYAPFDAEDVKRSSCSDAFSYREVIVHSAKRWVEQEFKRRYSNYTYNYNSCVPIEDVRLIIDVST